MRISKIRLVHALVVVAMIAAAFSGSAGSALAADVTDQNSGVQVANPGSSVANVVLTAYSQDGTTAGTQNDTIPANGSKTYFPLGLVTRRVQWVDGHFFGHTGFCHR